MKVLSNIDPKCVFKYFEEICQIPHGSGNCGKISEYCADFAKRNNLEYFVDSAQNVIIKKSATSGYEKHNTVILQGHLDMVCEKLEGNNFDFNTDPLDIKIEGDYISANGTTLGGDDGIAVAIILAILEDNKIEHPAIEALLTTDEEIGMCGAEALDATNLKGKALINIDSEEEGIFTVSCAGGARAEANFELERVSNSEKCYSVCVNNLLGGHSGVEINKGRLNANIVMGQFLKSVDFDYKIVSLIGGNKDNAIPRDCECIIATNGELYDAVEQFNKTIKTETDPDAQVNIKAVNNCETSFTSQASKKITDYLSDLPNGVVSMSDKIEGLVQTSLNLGIVSTKQNTINFVFSVRSSVNSEKIDLLKRLENTTLSFGGGFSKSGYYPAWEYREESVLRETMVNVYKSMFGKKPIIAAIHAGLECGILCEKIKGLDAVSIGPEMHDIHTPAERLSISSVKRTYEYLVEILKNL